MYGINYQQTLECVHSSSVNVFRNKIDKFLVQEGYT